MKLPNFERSYVDDAKLTSYLLDIAHSKGGPKARFFIRFGFSPEAPEILKAALLDHAQRFDVAAVQRHPRGDPFVILGHISTRDGRTPEVQTVWELDMTGAPRLITAYPS